MISIYNLCPQNFKGKVVFLSFSSRNKLLGSFLRLNGYLENKKAIEGSSYLLYNLMVSRGYFSKKKII